MRDSYAPPSAIAAALTAFVALAALAGCGAAKAGRPLPIASVAALPASRASHVLIVVMENRDYGEVIGSAEAPYVNSLTRRYGLATASYAITHPSLPNYLALTSGSTDAIGSDCTSCSVSGANIVDQLQEAGIAWRAYMEDLPQTCFAGATAAGYAKKHDPFAYFRDVASDPARCRRIVGFAALAADLRSGALPAFAWLSPNLCDDGHDCSTRTADRFLARTLPALLRELGPHGFLILTWDEGSGAAGCCGVAHGGRVATIVAGPDVRPGARQRAAVDDYGVLATIEDAFGLPRLAGARDARAGSLEGLFRSRHVLVPRDRRLGAGVSRLELPSP